MWILRAVFAVAVLACDAASATFAFEFGWTRGASDVHRWTYALAAVALDLVKCGLPLLGAVAWHGRERSRAAACWGVFVVLTVLSLWCAYGITATQLAERFAVHAIAATARTGGEAKLEALRSERAKLPVFKPMTLEGVTAARESVSAATATAKAECSEDRGGRGKACRERESVEAARRGELVKAIENKTLTDRAAALDIRIADAELAQDAIDVAAAVKDVDPQAASMAKATGVDQDLIAAISHVVLAIAIELGSGVGLWLVFGHGPGSGRQEFANLSQAAPAAGTPISEEPADQIQHFFLEAVRPALGARVAAANMAAAYTAWCAARGCQAVSATMFGRLAPWRKERIGGRIWYLDATLGEAYAGGRPVPRVAVDTSQRR